MSRGNIWATLGTEATTEARAIKKAYAARLKAIDVDSDPAAFITLREARDTALRLAAGQIGTPGFEPQPHAQPQPQAQPEPVFVPSARHAAPIEADPMVARTDAAPVALEERAAPARRSPWATIPIDNHMRAIADMLFVDTGEPLDAQALTRETEALLRHPQLDEIGRADETETWLAHVIVDGIPRSDAMIGPAMRRFDWAGKAMTWECPWAVQAVVDRAGDCQFRERAWRDTEMKAALDELANPPRDRRPLPLIPYVVRRFLHEVRTEHPSVERDLNPESVAWWDAYFARRRERFPWATALGLATILFAIERVTGSSDLPAEVTLALALAGAGGWFAARRWLERRPGGNADPWPVSPRQGAAILALLVLPLAAVLTPQSSLAFAGFAAAAGALALLAGPANRADDSAPIDQFWQARFALLGPVLWLHGALWAEAAWMQALVPAGAAAWTALGHGDRVGEAVLADDGDGSRARALRGIVFLAGAGLWFALTRTLAAPTTPPYAAALIALAVILVVVHQMLDPPDPWETEWKAGSVIAIIAAALGGPLLATMLVVLRTGRTVARTSGG